MKLGLVSAILPEYTFEEMVSLIHKLDMNCIEPACWPVGRAERRYAGVTHIDVRDIPDNAHRYLDALEANDVTISGLAYYPNPLDPDLTARESALEHLKKLIKSARALNTSIVNTFIGKMPKATPDENWKEFLAVWPDIIRLAEDCGVTVCIENCPMFFSMDEWPGGKNLASNPSFWNAMFEAIPSKRFALNYDPSHLVLQQMDYIAPIYAFAEKIKHVHIKDMKFYREKYDQYGFLATPQLYHSPKLPGLGDINWGSVISALNDIRYDGPITIETEDRAYEDSLESRIEGIRLSRRYMSQFLA